MITSRFNAPRDYSAVGGRPDDRHEGLDVAPTVAGESRVLNVYDGVVQVVRNSAGYGNYVIVRHQYEGIVFNTWRAHMASVVVSAGQFVSKGQVLGVCGSTGNSSGRHDHLTMTAPGYGLSGYIVSDVLNPEPFYP